MNLSKEYLHNIIMEEIGVVPNIYNIIWLFNQYNRAFFGGILPRPRIKLVHNAKVVGNFNCMFDEDGDVDDPEIWISDSFEYTERKLRDVLVHEMIHYYLAYMGEDKKISHGRGFREIAKEFNSKYGMNITKTIDTSGMNVINHNNEKKGFFSRLFS